MKKFLVVVAALACLGTVANAGPNAGGTIFVQDANLAYTTDIANYCGLGTAPATCIGADARIDAMTNVVWKVYAAFPENSTPRLKAITFGVNYDDSNIIVSAYGSCADQLELPGPGWPGPNTGTSAVWMNTQTALITEVYWFGGYNYGAGGLFTLIGNPDQGGSFADDSVPSILDPIAAYGSLGFGTDGAPACPEIPPPPGACCFSDGTCAMLLPADCTAQGGNPVGGNCDPNPCPPPPLGACCIGPDCTITTQVDCQGTWQGPDTTCDPNPCGGTPTETKTWGQIKNSYK